MPKIDEQSGEKYENDKPRDSMGKLRWKQFLKTKNKQISQRNNKVVD